MLEPSVVPVEKGVRVQIGGAQLVDIARVGLLGVPGAQERPGEHVIATVLPREQPDVPDEPPVSL